MTSLIFDEIEVTLAGLRQRSTPEAQADHLILRALETGGHVKPPCPGDSWDSQRVEIRIHGVFAEGGDWPEAIRNWQRAAAMAASRLARAQSDVTAAEALIADPAGAQATPLVWACETVLAHPDLAAPGMAARAQAVLDSLQRAEGAA